MQTTLKSKSVTMARLVAAATLAATSHAASAQAADTNGWALGLDLGTTRESFSCEGANRCDRTGATTRLTVGRQVNAFFSVQASYVANRGTGGSVTDPFIGAASISLKSRGAELAGLLHTPVARGFSGYAKLGLASMKTTGVATLPGFGSDEFSQRKTSPVVGLGVAYQVAPHIKLHAGYDWRRLSLDGERQSQRGLVLGGRFSF